jgi:arginyl-tRNA synthetase
MSLFEREQRNINDKLAAFCQRSNLPQMAFQWTSIPFAGQWGISTSFFQLASTHARNQGIKTNIPALAAELADAFAAELGLPDGFSKVESVKGYLNLTFDSGSFIHQVVDAVLREGGVYGKSQPTHQKMMVEYAQLNTHKSFHVGHLRCVILGACVSNLLEGAGHEVIRANYMGDIGAHVIKWMWNYLKRHNGERPEHISIRWLGDLYAEADQMSQSEPEAEAEIKTLFARWDARDPEVIDLWRKSREWSLEGFDEMFKYLGARFDRYYFPSEEEEDGKRMVEDLVQHGIAIDGRPGDAVIIKLDEILGEKSEKYRVLVVLRSDGTALYATQDLPLAVKKFSEYDLTKSIYVIDVRQSLYMQQIYKTLEIAGYPWADKCYHLAYEIVNLPGNVTMKSREGTVVLLEDLLAEAVKRAIAIVREKNPRLTEEEMTSIGNAVALGAIKFSMLNRDNTKIVTFDWEEALNFDGQAAPYIQYAHVRANSILRKSQSGLPDSARYDYPLEQSEIVLIDLISRFPVEVQRAAADLKPLYIANYAFKLAQSFNDFYNQCPVLQTTEPQRSARLRLVAAAKQTLANSLALLGITAPEAM